MTSPIVLMYHDVVSSAHPQASGFPAPDAAVYKLTQNEFQAHLDAIRDAGVSVTSTKDTSRWTSRDLLFTFDDGGVSFYDPIAAMLEDRGWRGHFFISTDYIGKLGFMTAGQIQDLHRRGHIIGSHSCSHPVRMAACTAEQLEREWRESISTLEAILGDKVLTASVPGGYYSRQVGQTAALAGITILFNSEPESRARPLMNAVVLGRYTIRAGMKPSQCAALATGNVWPALRQKLLWTTKKAAKALGGTAYLKVRQFLLSR